MHARIRSRLRREHALHCSVPFEHTFELSPLASILVNMAPKNKIVKLDEFSMSSDLSHVQVVDAPMPEPKQGEVLVNAYLRPVNPTDVILIKTGWGGLVPLPSTPGSEGVGKVVKNGPGASKFKEGQRVAAAPWPQFQGRGSWAQYVAIPEKDLVSHPTTLCSATSPQVTILIG